MISAPRSAGTRRLAAAAPWNREMMKRERPSLLRISGNAMPGRAHYIWCGPPPPPWFSQATHGCASRLQKGWATLALLLSETSCGFVSGLVDNAAMSRAKGASRAGSGHHLHVCRNPPFQPTVDAPSTTTVSQMRGGATWVSCCASRVPGRLCRRDSTLESRPRHAKPWS